MKNKSVYLLAILLSVFAARASAQISGRRGICVWSSSTLSASGGGSWSSSNTAIADVDPGTGEVYGIAAGNAIITYSIGTQTTTVTVIDPGTPLTLSPPHDGYICMGAPWTVNAPSGGTWSSADDGIATATLIGPYPTNPTENATITGEVAGPVTVYVYVDYPGGCQAQALIKVGLPDIVGETDLCIGEVYDRLTCTSAGLTWRSNNPAIAEFNDQFLTPTQESGRLFGISAGTTTITFTKYAGCIETRTVNISAGSSISGTASVCTGQTTALSCSPSGGTWSSANTSVATVNSSSGVATGVAAGTAIITYTPTEGCPSVITITVSSGPGAITGTLSVCPGKTTALGDPTGGGTWSSSNTSVATVNSSGVVTGVATGTATITYDLGAGCYATAQVTVNETPAISGSSVVCIGATVTLTGASGGGTWSSSNTGVATVNSSGVVTGIASSTATITYTLSTGCYATATITSGSNVASISGPSSVCTGYTISLTGTPSGGTWNSSNTAKATVDASGIVTGVASGTAKITYTAAAGCTATVNVTVGQTPTVSSSQSQTVCPDYSITISCTCGSGCTTPLTWSSSNTSIATVTSGTVTPVAAGTALITMTNGSGCYATRSYTVNATPQITTVDNTMCKNSSQTLVGSPTGGTWITTAASIVNINSSSGVATSGNNTGNATIKYYTFSNLCYAHEVISVSSCGKIGNTNGDNITISDEKPGYSIMPNPGNGRFEIARLSGLSGPAHVRVMNYSGASVYSAELDFANGKGILSIPADKLSTGLYIVAITDDNQNGELYKVIVQE